MTGNQVRKEDLHILDEAWHLEESSVFDLIKRSSLTFFDEPLRWLNEGMTLLERHSYSDARVAFEHTMDLTQADGVLDRDSATALLYGSKQTINRDDRIHDLGRLFGNGLIQIDAALCLAHIFSCVGRLDQAEDALHLSGDALRETVAALQLLAENPKALGFQIDFSPDTLPAFMALAMRYQEQNAAVAAACSAYVSLELN